MTHKIIINRKLFIGACCLMAAGCFLYYLANLSLVLTEKNQQVAGTQITSSQETNADTSNLLGHTFQEGSGVIASHQPIAQDLSTPATMDDTRTMAGTPAEAAIVRQWMLSRGQYLKEDLYDYLSYDWDTSTPPKFNFAIYILFCFRKSNNMFYVIFKKISKTLQISE